MLLQRFNSVKELPEQLFAQFPSSGNPFLTYRWFLLFEQSLIPEGYAPRYYLVTDPDQQPQALLPCLARLNKRGNTTSLTALSNFYSGDYLPLTIQECDLADLLLQLISAIAVAEPCCWQINLAPLLPQRPSWPGLLMAFKQSGWTTEPYFCHANWILHLLNGGFAAYWQQRASLLRNNCQRKKRKLEKALGYQMELLTEEGPALEEALRHYHRIYSLSWKQEEPYPDFISELCRQLARSGDLRLGILRAGDRVIAAQIWMLSRDRAYIFKLAHDPEFACYSPGTLLTRELMAHVLDADNLCEVDFLSGDDRYKQDWMNQRRERWGIQAYRHGHPRGLVAALASRSRQALKALLGRRVAGQ